MRDKTEQIIQAALQVFLKYGYKEATTQEIAKQAGVAEITLFRKFSTKRNLFLSVVKPIIAYQFDSHFKAMAKIKDTDAFFREILQDRLEALSKNRAVMRMLISESLMDRLDKEVDMPTLIFSNLIKVIDNHFSEKGIKADVEGIARMIGSILLSNVLWPEEIPYEALSNEEKQLRIERYLGAIKAVIAETN